MPHFLRSVLAISAVVTTLAACVPMAMFANGSGSGYSGLKAGLGDLRRLPRGQRFVPVATTAIPDLGIRGAFRQESGDAIGLSRQPSQRGRRGRRQLLSHQMHGRGFLHSRRRQEPADRVCNAHFGGGRARLLSRPKLHPCRRSRPPARLQSPRHVLRLLITFGFLKKIQNRQRGGCTPEKLLYTTPSVERALRLSVRTAPFHGAERGSIPLGVPRFSPTSCRESGLAQALNAVRRPSSIG